MKFLFADCVDYIDPGYDFLRDQPHPDRIIGVTDRYAHEYFGEADQKPYDGLLVSYEIVFGKGKKYTDAQGQRFRAEGAPRFLRFDPHPETAPLFGDCGAFSYAKDEVPPYDPAEIARFYQDCGFTHGISVDHIIFTYENCLTANGTADDKRRYEITQRNNHVFLEAHRRARYTFTPVAAIQGWNPTSMARAAREAVDMGYDYIAIGGLVPLKPPEIHAAVRAIREAAPTVKVHLLGFTKANHIHEFVDYNITTFDSSSPLIRAFKDNRNNYWADDRSYTALRIPPVGDNPRVKRRVLAGQVDQEIAKEDERWALDQVRALSALPTPPSEEEVEIALEEVLRAGAYVDPAISAKDLARLSGDNEVQQSLFDQHASWLNDKYATRAADYRATLRDRPWLDCPCRVCQEAGVDVILFRGSNRNKRRGFHNLFWFYQHLQRTLAHARAEAAEFAHANP